MKRNFLFAALAAAAVLLLTGCASSSSSSFGVVSAGDAGITITAQNAEANSSGSTEITVAQEGKAVFDATSLKTGKLQIQLKDAQGNEMQSTSVSAKDKASFDIVPGEYKAEVSVLEKADGTASFRIDAR